MKTLQSKSKCKHILIAGMLTWGVLPYAAASNENTMHFEGTSVEQQNETVKGTVLDKKTGEPIIGANIVVKGTTNGVITDIDGNYTLQAPVGSILEISYIGYQTIEITATDQVQVVELSEDTEVLEEVVVVGY